MEKIARKAAMFFIEYGDADETNLDIYEYGILVGLSFFTNAVITVTLGIVFSVFRELSIFFAVFAVHRSLAGGYHAKTWQGCLLASSSVMAIMIVLFRLPCPSESFLFSAVCCSISVILTFMFAPIENSSRLLTDTEVSVFRKYSRLFTAICAASAITMCSANNVHMKSYGFCIALALGVSGLSQLIAILQKSKKEDAK